MKRKRLSDKAYVCLNLQVFGVTTQFYVSRKYRKKYGGIILNEGLDVFDVQIESMQGYYSMRRTLPPGEWLEFRNYPLSGVTFYGSGTFTLVAWAGLTPVDFVRTSAIRTVNVNNFPPPQVLSNMNIAEVAGAVPSCTNPLQVQLSTGVACYDARQIRALAFATDSVDVSGSSVSVINFPAFPATQNVNITEYLSAAVGPLNPMDVKVSNFPAFPALQNVNLTEYLSAAVGPLNPVDVKVSNFPVGPFDVSDRAGRLLGIIYGNLGQLDQIAIAGRNVATIDNKGWFGSVAPTVGQKTMVNSIPVAIASDNVTGVTGIARLQPWYQPNFLTVNKQYYANAIGPHNLTQRWIYTVPAGRIALVMGSACAIERDAATATPGTVQAYILINGITRFPYFIEVTGTTGVEKVALVGQSAILNTGETIEAYTFDLSIGGSYTYSIGANIMEFNK